MSLELPVGPLRADKSLLLIGVGLSGSAVIQPTEFFMEADDCMIFSPFCYAVFKRQERRSPTGRRDFFITPESPEHCSHVHGRIVPLRRVASNRDETVGVVIQYIGLCLQKIDRQKRIQIPVCASQKIIIMAIEISLYVPVTRQRRDHFQEGYVLKHAEPAGPGLFVHPSLRNPSMLGLRGKAVLPCGGSRSSCEVCKVGKGGFLFRGRTDSLVRPRWSSKPANEGIRQIFGRGTRMNNCPVAEMVTAP
ncbi:hypothetical protein R3P38DRAFT_1790072 [Favolaschia claudopus]|uniref:Uncharacterized protein n=1 Tax=Favolaschia claudopus TaxID=2862362 RepID=A0AAW0A5W7_9AGAR